MDPYNVYDMAALSWIDRYNFDGQYYVPPKIAALVGGTSQGGATVTSPEAGWDDKYLKAVFGGTPVSTEQPSAGSKPGPGIIAGSVVGGVVGAGAAVALLLFWRLRRRQKDVNAPAKPPVGESGAEADTAAAGGGYHGGPTSRIPGAGYSLQEMGAGGVERGPGYESWSLDEQQQQQQRLYHELDNSAVPYELQDSSVSWRGAEQGHA
jgi:hypothetical protein